MSSLTRFDALILGAAGVLLGLTQALHFGIVPMTKPIARFVYGYVYGRMGMVSVVLIFLWIGFRYREPE